MEKPIWKMCRANQMEIKLLSWNCNGLEQSIKLINLLRKAKLSREKYSIICLQEIKTAEITKGVLNTIKNFRLKFKVQPPIGRSGRLLILWNEDKFENPPELIYQNEACQVMKFSDLKSIVFNVYIRTASYVRTCLKVQEGVDKVSEADKELNIFLVGDLNAFNNVKRDRSGHSSKATVTKDHHISIFKRLLPILDQLYLTDVALELQENDFTRMCKKTATRTRIGYIFIKELHGKLMFEQKKTNMSDHDILELAVHSETEIDIGPGYWRLNNNILRPNYQPIQNLLTTFNDSNDYDQQKQTLRDMLRDISIRKRMLESKYKKHLETCLLTTTDPHLQNNQNNYQEKIDEVDYKEYAEIMACMKSTIKEVNEGNPKEVKKWSTKSQQSTIIRKLVRL